MSAATTLELPDLAATDRFGRQLASCLFPGAVVGLVGPLGAGKTQLVRAAAAGLGVPARQIVNSPTFVLIQEYIGRIPIFHFDAYRLASPAEFFDLGISEYFTSDGVCFIEWADRVAQYLPESHLRIALEICGPTARRAEIEARGDRYAELIRRLS